MDEAGSGQVRANRFSERLGPHVSRLTTPSRKLRIARTGRKPYGDHVGVMRHADAGYEEAKACAKTKNIDLPMETDS